MNARKYAVELTGVTPMLMHADNLQWAKVMDAWQKDPANRKVSTAGDDRTPAWRWIGSAYVDGGRLVIPADNLMTVLREGGAKCPTGQRGGTYKRQTQSGLVVDQAAWPLIINGGEVPYAPIKSLIEETDFAKHEAVCAKLGFALFVKRAKVGQSKHVRVRPRFDTWGAAGTITVFDETISKDVLANILTFAGTYAGLGDWRPSSQKSPGPFGKFTAKIKEA